MKLVISRAVAVSMALLIVCVSASPAFASPPPSISWPDAVFKGKAKTSNIGYGMKAKPIQFRGQSDDESDANKVFFQLQLTGKATKQGIYRLAVYYKGHRVDVATLEDGWSNAVSFGVVKGKVNKATITAEIYIDDDYAVDRSKIKVKRVKFIPGYKLDVDWTTTNMKYNNLKIWLNEIVALGETAKKVRLRSAVNDSSYIVKKNAKVNFCAFGYAKSRFEQSGVLSFTVAVGKKKASGDVIVVKGDRDTNYMPPPPTDTDNSYSAPTNWHTSPVKVTTNTKAKIDSVSFTPFNFDITGTAIALPIGNDVSAKAEKGSSYSSYWYKTDATSSVVYALYDTQAYYSIQAVLNGKSATSPTLQNIKLNYEGDTSNLDFAKVRDGFIVTDSHEFKADEDELHFKIPIKDLKKPATLDLSKLTYSYATNNDIVKLSSSQYSGGEYESLAEVNCKGLTFYADVKKPTPIVKSRLIYSKYDSHRYGYLKKGGNIKLQINAYGKAKKSGTIKYTVKVNGKAYKSWTKKVVKNKEYDGKLKKLSIKANGNITVSLKTKFTPA